MLYTIQSVSNGYLLNIFITLLTLLEVVLVKFIRLSGTKDFLNHGVLKNKNGIDLIVALKSLDNSSDISKDFLNEVP